MLESLRLTNFAVVEEAELTFGQGLTVITGETGAGKSIVIDALGLALGGRGGAELIRADADEASIEAVFKSDPKLNARLEDLGLPVLGDEVLVRRVIGKSAGTPKGGRSRAWVNGALVTVGVLSELMRGRVEVAGQHEHMALLDPAQHLPLLDEATPVAPLEQYAAAWHQLQACERELSALGGDDAQLAQRADFIRFQLDELDRVAPNPDEDLALEAERARLASVERLRTLASSAQHLMCEREDAAVDLVGQALSALLDIEKTDPKGTELKCHLQAAAAELQELGRGLTRYLSGLEADPARLAEVEDRLDQIKRLCRKHAAPLSAVIAKRAELTAELERLSTRSERREAALVAKEAALAAVRRAAAPLTEARAKAGAALEAAVRDRLKRLAMPRAVFRVVLSAAEPGPHGADVVELTFSANPGEPPRPLAKVASGGEASRLMLAMRAAAEPRKGTGSKAADVSATIVFDEADAGVGGAVADAVGRLIKDVSQRRQVLCVTHLAQVAAHADLHLKIEKHQERRSTRSVVHRLSPGDARERELARMLSGLTVSREAVGAARSLLRSARQPPRQRLAG